MGRVSRANYWSNWDVRFVYLGRSIEVKLFAVVRSQFVSRQREGKFCVW
jgi:hypothetical protein